MIGEVTLFKYRIESKSEGEGGGALKEKNRASAFGLLKPEKIYIVPLF